MTELELIEVQTAKAELELAKHRLRPSYGGTQVLRRGSRWLCILGCSEIEAECPHAYGDCPEEACLNFDLMWEGKLIQDEYEEEF